MVGVDKEVYVANNEYFVKSSYNGISVIIREKDGYINATSLCNQFGKRLKKLFENQSWKEYLQLFMKEYYNNCENSNGPNSGPCKNEALYLINSISFQ